MEVNVASRKDLADAIQSYNDNDNVPLTEQGNRDGLLSV